jgi:hypothetical protein
MKNQKLRLCRTIAGGQLAVPDDPFEPWKQHGPR